jgi:hypothetical protein
MAIEKKPHHPVLKGYTPPNSNPYRIKDGDNWWNVAAAVGMEVWELIEFNYKTRDPAEVNWYLKNYVGCVLLTQDGKNYRFTSSATPGIIYVPSTPKPPKMLPRVESYPYKIPGKPKFAWSTSIDRLTETASLIPLRIYADTFIPWEWVEIPDYPVILIPVPIYPLIATKGLGFYVHGDKRLQKHVYTQVGNKYRTRGIVEANLIESKDEVFFWAVNNQPSKSQFRIEDNLLVGKRILGESNGSGSISGNTKVMRLGPSEINIDISVSGSAPPHVAGPQPAIDFHYRVNVWCDTEVGAVLYKVNVEHDGFPAHEFFLDCHGQIRARRYYNPDWFDEIMTATASPGIKSSINGSRALAGQYKKQIYSFEGSFML